MRFSLRIADLCDLPFEDGEFDVVCSYKVLAHVQNITRALEEATRVTRSRGLCIAVLRKHT